MNEIPSETPKYGLTPKQHFGLVGNIVKCVGCAMGLFAFPNGLAHWVFVFLTVGAFMSLVKRLWFTEARA
jgi:hypothetical protein